MAQKSKNDLLGYVLIAILVGVVWLFKTIGWWAIVIIVVVFGVLFYIALSKEKLPDYPTDDFGPLFPSPTEASNYFSRLYKADFTKGQRLRDQQILRESLLLALTSKKRETAESRMALAKEKFESINNNPTMTKEEWARIAKRYKHDLAEFATNKYINAARGHIERTSKLKSERGKTKYIDLARQVIIEGLQDPDANKELLNNLLSEISGTDRVGQVGPE